MEDATGVIVTEKLPKGLTYLSALPSNDFIVTTSADGKEEGKWTIGTIPNGESRTLTVTGVVNGKETTIVNTVLVETTIVNLNPINTSTATVSYIKDCELKVYNYVSANNDGQNDHFIIENIDCYPENTVEIYNRWGAQVYQTENYGTDSNSANTFRGISEGRGTISQDKTLPEGTYFYIIRYKGSRGEGDKNGYLELTR